MTQIPSIGRIVHYTLTEQDAATINKRREDATRNQRSITEQSTGFVAHVGNEVSAGDVFPMMIVRVWGDRPTSAVNGQVALDGNDSYWATSRCEGIGEGRWAWPSITR